ncbi:CPBP family intramembrane glutamic endopeptidase [Tepidiforma sp.]|uniref:CPBP family intramembrane glutamic endopeptidase n=1 Tax=Tepidiforma sp. TaxID=2682230 RepID=UPI002ADE4BB4|nr:CPBP family intramembrane glutamic endopeptidase [Tepidiforma sp.]
MPWGPREAFTGLAAFVALLVLTNVVAAGVAAALDFDLRTRDVGDTFEKAGRIAEYADARLAAAASGEALPSPPELLASQDALQVLLSVTAVSQAATLAIVGIVTRRPDRQLLRDLRLDTFAWSSAWLPLAAVLGAYLLTFAWVAAVERTGIDWLIPTSTVPYEITRDDLTLAIAAAVTVVGAPVTEELFFRGLLFGGLSRWGFWPAAGISGLLFSLVHFDPGSVVPFFLIALILAWLNWRSRSLWHPIIFHFLFNAISFSILAFS